jgi:hypothetical protein
MESERDKQIIALLKELGYDTASPVLVVTSAAQFLADNAKSGGFPAKDSDSLLLALQREVDAKRAAAISVDKSSLGWGVLIVGLGAGLYALGRRKRR